MRLPTVNKFQDRWEDIVKNVKLGMTQQRSAEAEGVAVQTLYHWIKRAKAARDGDEEYVKFYAELRRANARCERRAAKHLTNAAEFDWKAALALLERRFPGDWGKRIETEDKWEVMIRELGLDPEDILHEVVTVLGEKHNELGELDSEGDGEIQDEPD